MLPNKYKIVRVYLCTLIGGHGDVEHICRLC